MSVVAIAAFSAFLLASVAEVAPSPQMKRDIVRLERIVKGDPERDARAALRRGKKEFLGVAGFALEIHGVPQNIMNCPIVYRRATVLRGTSDFIFDEKYGALVERARVYSAAYNSVIAANRAAELSRKCAAP